MAGMTVAELVARLRADTGDFESGMVRAESSLTNLEGSTNSAGSTMMRLADTVTGTFDRISAGVRQLGIGIASAAAGAVAYVGSIGVKYNELLQSAGAGFTTLLGSAEKAKMFMAEINDFARSSPFPKQEFIQAAQELLGFGVAAKSIVPIFKAVQDAAGGMANPAIISHISDVMARIQSLGHASTMLLDRFSEDGINAFGILATESGKSMKQIRDEVKAGSLDATTAITLLTQGMEKQFKGGANNLEKTWVGAFDHLKASIRDIGGGLVSSLIDPSIGSADGGLLAKWARSAGDALRTFEKTEVPALSKAIGNFFLNIQDWVSKLPLHQWLQDGKELWAKYSGVVAQFAPVLGAVAAAFAKVGLSQIPVLGAFSSFLPIPGPLVSGLLALVATNSQLRDMFLSMARTVGDIVGPALKQLIPVVVESATKIVGVIALLAQQNVGQISQVFADMANVFTQLLPPMSNVIAFLLILASRVVIPLISGFAQLTSFMADNYKVFAPLAAIAVVAAAWFGKFSTTIQLLQFAFGQAHPIVYRFFQLLDTNPYMQLIAGTVLVGLAINNVFGLDIPKAVSVTFDFFKQIPEFMFNVLKGALDVVIGFADAISQALKDAFDPWQRHSPSLVDQVISGTSLITSKYGDMARSIVPAMRDAQAAMVAMNLAAKPLEAGVKSGDLTKLGKDLAGVENGAAVLATYKLLDAQVVDLTKQLSPLQDALARETDVLAKQQKALNVLNVEYAAQQRAIQKTQQQVTAASKDIAEMAQQLADAQKKLQDFLSTPLQGSSAFDDALFANQQSIAALQYKLNKLNLAGDTSDQVQILTDKIARLNVQGQQISLQKQLTLGPQQHELDKLKSTTKEMSFSDLAAGIKSTQDQIAGLTDKLKPAQDNLKGLQDILDAQTLASQNFHDSIDAATLALDAQKTIVDDLKGAIGDMTAALDGFAKRQAEIVKDAALRFQQLKALATGSDPGVTDNSGYKYAVPTAKVPDVKGLGDIGKNLKIPDFTKQFKEMGDKVQSIFNGLLLAGGLFEFFKFFNRNGKAGQILAGVGLKAIETGSYLLTMGAMGVKAAVETAASWAVAAASMAADIAVNVATGIAEYATLAAAAIADAAAVALAWLAANPELLIVAGIAAAAILIAKNWDNIKQWAADAVNFISDHWKLIFEIITGPFGLATVFIIDHWQQILDGAQTVFGFITGLIGGFIRFVMGIPGAVGGALSGMWNIAWNEFKTIFGWIEDGFNRVISFVASVPGVLAKVGSGMWGFFKTGLVDVINGVISGIEMLVNFIIDGMRDAIGLFNAIPFVPNLPKPEHITLGRVEWKAEGGLFDHKQIIGVGEAGRELLLPLTNMQRTMALLEQSGVMNAIMAKKQMGMKQVMPTFPQINFGAGANGVDFSLRGNGGTYYSVSVRVDGTVVSEGNLVDAIHDGLIQKGTRNGGIVFERQSA